MVHIRGKVTRQAHVGVPEGTYEEEIGREGFFGNYAHLYRSHPPVDWTRIEGELKPRNLEIQQMAGLGGDYLNSRHAFLRNGDCVLRFAVLADAEAMPYCFRNADGDEALFVHAGAGRLDTDYGPLEYETGDYLIIPRGTVYRLIPSAETRLLITETRGAIEVPDRGLMGQHALFDPAMLNVPTPAPPAPFLGEDTRKEWPLKIQRGGRLTTVYYPHHPIDVVGWKGTLSVWQLNIRDIRPVLSDRYHLPPTAHATFAADGVYICTFLPRPLENGDPEAVKVPFYHANIDFDEVLFYHDGDFFSRSGVSKGSVTFHPAGIHHGPHPKAVERTADKKRTDETAVMIDTRQPLEMTEHGAAVNIEDYWKSWQS